MDSLLSSDDPIITHDDSLHMLEDLGKLLNSVKKGKRTKEVMNVENITANAGLVLESLCPKKDQGTQTILSNSREIEVNFYSHRHDRFESESNDNHKDLKLLSDKLLAERKLFEKRLDQYKLELEYYQAQTEELKKKIYDLENVIRFSQVCIPQDTKLGKKVNSTHTITNYSGTHRMSIEILADSHGRQIPGYVGQRCKHKVFGLIKPGAGASPILSANVSTSKVQSNNYVFVILAGANDVYCNNSRDFLRVLKAFLAAHLHVNTIVCTLPIRYDLPMWSVVNEEIRTINDKIRVLKKHFKKLWIIELDKIGRRFHTNHGLHMNTLGKEFITEQILRKIKDLELDAFDIVGKPIPLPWDNKYPGNW